jgi:hypothetical protein
MESSLPLVDLIGAPAEYPLPAARPSLEEAKQRCPTLRTTHSQNFHVPTFFLPKRFRSHLDNLSAYCRVSEQSQHPVFAALREIIVACELPRHLLHDWYDPLRRRPEVSTGKKARLLVSAVWGERVGGFAGSGVASVVGTTGAAQ